MTDVNEGLGEAQDAVVVTMDNVASADGVLNQEDPRLGAEAAVKAAEAKVEKQKAHLAGAEQALEAAKADLAALNQGD